MPGLFARKIIALSCLVVVAGAWADEPSVLAAAGSVAAPGEEGGASLCGDGPLTQMQARLPQCLTNAVFLANLGYRLNAEGRYAEAVDHLERALMLNPELKGARIDYALALMGLGELQSAHALMAELLADPDLPPAATAGLRRQQQRLSLVLNPASPLADPGAALAAPGAGLQWRRSVGLRAGHDSNLLGAPNLATITITLPGAPSLPLPLDDSYRPVGGAYLRADATLEASLPGDGGVTHEAALNLQAKHSPEVDRAGTQQYELFLERARAAQGDGPGHFTQFSLGGLHTDTGVRYRVWRAAAGAQWAGLPGLGWTQAPCQTRLGAELQDRQLDSTPVLSGHYVGLTALWRCAPAIGSLWQLAAQAGQDRPKDSQRPGGPQTLYSLRLTGLWPVRQLLNWVLEAQWPGSVLLDLEHARSRDHNGYTPLLEYGVARRIARTNLRLEWQRPLGGNGFQLFAGGQWLAQSANIGLFSQRSWGPYLGVRAHW